MSSSSDVKPNPSSAAPESSAPSKAGGKAKARAPRPIDEGRLDAPSRQTLIVLGVVAFSTLAMWAMGRAACNYHVPGESLTPRTVGLEEKTFHPKDVAVEFAQAVVGARFNDAKLLAAGPAVEFVAQEQAGCGTCVTRVATRSSLRSVPSVLKANPAAGYVHVKTTGDASVNRQFVFLVERKDKGWKVTNIMPSATNLPELPTAPLPSGQGPLAP